MRPIAIFAAVLSLFGCEAAFAQQDTTKCATVTVSRATEADIPALIEDAECFAKALQSAANSQALRLAKAKELAKRPWPAPTPSPSPTPTPAPTPTPTPTPDHGNHEPPPPPQPLTVADITPLAVITDPSPYLWRVPLPGTAAPDNVGAFRFVCNISHLASDDPIVYPGQKGKSHPHMFFGNTQADANSTYESLRTSGGSTCQGDVLNRSAYWMPTLLSASDSGLAVMPDFVGNYYKRRPASDPECLRAPHKGCVGIPAGLRAIFGTNYVQDHAQSPHVRFDCASGFSEPTLAAIVERCRGASHIYARIEAPDCWNGRDLDSVNHQEHLAYMFYDGTRPTARCPDTHPYVIPQLSLIAAFAVLPGDTPETWIFSSDVQAGKAAGETFHADYMEAWEPATRLTWEAHCLDKLLNCSAAEFGNGTQGKTPAGFSFAQRPHLIPIPE